MTKALFKILAPVIVGTAFLAGCGSSYNDFKNGKFNEKQNQFIREIKTTYGEQVTYHEMKTYVSSKLDKNKAKIINKCLKNHAEKRGLLENLNDQALVIVYEAIERLE